LACALAVTAAGCKPSAQSTPKGQVVATVNGEEITSRELDSEVRTLPGVTAANLKEAQQLALRNIVYRRLVAQEAKKEKIDQSPDFALDQQRVQELLLAKTMQDNIVKEIPEPTPQEAQQYIDANPNIFAQRKIFHVQEIRFEGGDPKLYDLLRPLNTMKEVQDLLDSRHVSYRMSEDRIDAIGSDPNAINQIAALKPGELFVLPVGGETMVNVVTNTEVLPYTGASAVQYASDIIKRTRAMQATQKRFGQIISQAPQLVKYNPAFKPKAPAASAKPAAPAASSGGEAPSQAAPAANSAADAGAH
jgi:EpsD family peptidyl-prolyl cis-trans isomerase